jgi:hypothetical protein
LLMTSLLDLKWNNYRPENTYSENIINIWKNSLWHFFTFEWCHIDIKKWFWWSSESERKLWRWTIESCSLFDLGELGAVILGHNTAVKMHYSTQCTLTAVCFQHCCKDRL